MRNKDAKVITFSIFKGGTGKTTSAVNTAVALAKKKHRVLLLDLDHQANSQPAHAQLWGFFLRIYSKDTDQTLLRTDHVQHAVDGRSISRAVGTNKSE